MTTRFGRLVETGLCFPVGPWRNDGFRRPRYRWRFWSNPPGGNPFGAPKNHRKNNPGYATPWSYGLTLVKSDDAGLSWQPSSDFIQSFFDVFDSLQITDEGTPDFPDYLAIWDRMAPGYHDAALALQPLMLEINDVLANEPASPLGGVQAGLNMLMNGFQTLAVQLDAGAPSVAACQQIELGLRQMASQIQTYGTRFQHAAQKLNRAADAYQLAGQQIPLFPNPVNIDQFLYALLDKAQDCFQHAAMAFMPHIRLQLNPGSYLADRASFTHGADVLVTNQTTGEVLDMMNVPVADDYTIDIPIMTYEENAPLRIGVKWDTFNSFLCTTPAQDGLVFGPFNLRNGDVDNDDRITPNDVARVQADIGQGGMDAPVVPETDLNNDGRVDLTDLSIVNANLGFNGGGFKAVSGRIELGDFVGDSFDYEFQMQMRDGSGNVLQESGVQLDDTSAPGEENYSFFTARTGTFTVNAKGAPWLGQNRNGVLVGPANAGGVNFALTNGDSDGDNEVGIGDYALLSSAYNSTPGTLTWFWEADMNGDEAVDIADYAILSSNYGLTGE